MNSRQHGDIVLIAAHMSGATAAQAESVIRGAEQADYLDDVLCSIPFEGDQPEVCRKTLTSLGHFEPGFYWDADRSLGPLEALGEVVMRIAGTTVTGTTPPMLRACQAQPGAPLCNFRFPGAAENGAYHAKAPPWTAGWGIASHLGQDVCLPHHIRGMLLAGHQAFEDCLERIWFQHRRMLALASERKQLEAEFCARVRAVKCQATTVEDLIKENAAWARDRFRLSTPGAECSITECLDICIRAIASTMRMLKIMTGRRL